MCKKEEEENVDKKQSIENINTKQKWNKGKLSFEK